MCIRDRLNDVVAAAHTVYSDALSAVVLFGSYARGDYSSDSDVDVILFVDLPKTEIGTKYFDDILPIGAELSLKYGILVSIKTQSTTEYRKYRNIIPFYRNIANEGSVYYGAIPA